MKQSKFTVGDRVRVYDGSRIRVGTVTEPGTYGFPGCVDVEYDETDHEGNIERVLVHYKQCRRLKPKAKSVRVTREMVEAAFWEAHRVGIREITPGCVLVPEDFLSKLCRALGLDSEEK